MPWTARAHDLKMSWQLLPERRLMTADNVLAKSLIRFYGREALERANEYADTSERIGNPENQRLWLKVAQVIGERREVRPAS
jgi:hypothetical protein